MTTKTLALLAGTALAGLVFGGAAQSAPLVGTAGGSFSNLNNCDNSGSTQDCRIVNTGNGNSTQVQWGSTQSGTNFVNPSTLTSVDVSINTNTTALGVVIGQLQWFNSATNGSQTPDAFSVRWNYSIDFSQPNGPDDDDSTTFTLVITNPVNATGDNIAGLALSDLSGIDIDLAGMTISNFRYLIEDLGGNSGAAGCGGDDTTLSAGGVWNNCEGNTANLYILADFVSPTTSVPEPAALALFGAGLAGLGLVARRRRSA